MYGAGAGAVSGGQKQASRKKRVRRDQSLHNAHPQATPAPAPTPAPAAAAAPRALRGVAWSLRARLASCWQRRLADDTCKEELEECSLSGARHRPEDLGELARSTRFTRHEIKLMYRGFKQECPSGVVDEEAFKNIFSQFFPLGDATQYAHFVFKTIKQKQSGKVNFEEFLSILSLVARGSLQEKLSWVFALYDVDGDGRISRAEMLQVVRAVYQLLGRAAAPPAHHHAAEDHVDRIFHLIDTNADGVVTPDELARWCRRDPAVLRSFDTLDTVL